MWFEDTQHGIAVGAYGALIETIDGGQSWDDISDRLENEDGFHLNAIAHIEGSGLFVVGEMGGMFRSADMGETREKVESPYQGSFFGVVGGSEPGVVIAFGLRGHLFRSADFGDSWEGIELRNGNGHALESGSPMAACCAMAVSRWSAMAEPCSPAMTGRSFKLVNRPDRRSLSGVTSDSQGNLIW